VIDDPVAGRLALPNPEAKRVANLTAREQSWQDLEKASKTAGINRNKRTGRYVGGPAEVTSPQKRTAVAKRYADRTQAALDAGIPPGYFYDEGRQALARITDNPAEHELASLAYGPTSTQVGPFQNTNYMVRAFDQNAMGVPTNVTLYPNAQRRQMDAVMHGEDPWKGYKVDRYSYLLGPREPHVNPLQNMPPNDQWEGFGTGFPKGTVPAGPNQVAWSDDIRRRAADRLNTRRAEQGQKPLTNEEIQELHWASIRAETEGRPLELGPKDTVQGSLPSFRMQHGWEAEPGPTSGIGRLMSKEDYAGEVADVVLDEAGKDRIIRAMGGRLQDPAVRGSGVWEGEINPGFQSRSFVSHTQDRGLDPASAARVDATEAVRQYMLGQEGRAYSLNQPAKSATNRSIADFGGGIPSPEETARLQGILGEDAVVMPTADGYRVVSTGGDGKAFTETVGRLGGEPTYGKNVGGYDVMDWKGGRATEGLLGALDQSGMPGPRRLADSPQTRAIAGEMADLYQKLDAAGGLSQNQSLTRALETWRDQGLDGLRGLVKRGLAPAALLTLFAGAQGPASEPESGPG
jgi:hypothetical protein